MSTVCSGDIVNFTTVLKLELDKISKTPINLSIDEDRKVITIPISQDIDIYTCLKNNILNIFIFSIPKKTKLTANIQLININYNDAISYNIISANKNIPNISKNTKKHKLEMITKISDNKILFKLANKYLIIIDSNGSLYYYPDSIQTIKLTQWPTIMNYKEDQNNIHTLDKYLAEHKIINLNCTLSNYAYDLQDIHLDTTTPANDTITPANDTTTPANDNEYSRISYLLSWLNPLAYYKSSSILENANNQINDYNKDNKDNNKDIDDARYYIDTTTSNIIKIQDGFVKVLKLKKIDIPMFITDISINDIDEVLFYGHIQETPINIKFNKYMVNMVLC